MSVILDTEDPKEFRSKRVRIARTNDSLDARILEPQMGFPEMMQYRKPADAQAIRDGLNNGYDFANLGVSAVLTITLNGEDYLLAVKQDRLDIGDSVAKLVSGYVDAKDLKNPAKAIEKEISEEVLFSTSEMDLMRFQRNHSRWLPKPFADKFDDCPFFVDIRQAAKYDAPGLVKKPVTIDGKLVEDSPGLYFQAPTNSAQLVYVYHLEPADIELEKLGVSLFHSEDKLNKEKGVLEKILQPDGILLFKLKDRDLTGDVYTYEKGKLVPYNAKNLVLSEAFAPKTNGIAEAKNITLADYLKK